MRDGQNIGYYKDGSIRYEYWYKDDKYHRLDGPASIDYYEDGSISYERWYKDGKYHRLDGPASINYHKDGSISYEDWYKDGEELTKEEFEAQKDTCEGKVVTIDGKKYKLKEVT